MAAVALLLLSLLCASIAASPPHLNIHVLAHTHDDVGWLKTVDEYYFGANNSIQNARVQYILDTVTRALLETAYFYRWWNEQSDTVKAAFRTLVASGQLEFVSGGWCMNDEASVHYEAVIDQMTEGHQFLLQEFGVQPRIGWQIDPFGHASEYANLVAQMGFDGLFFARIDYQDYAVRAPAKELEFVWRPTQSLGAQTEIFTHVMYATSYCWAANTGFERTNVEPVQDDTNLFDLNIQQQADAFAADMRTRAEFYTTNNLLVMFGCDFAFAGADVNFKNMDKLMAYVNANYATYGLVVNYSTPSLYVAAVHAANQSYTVKTDDFFPYANAAHCYWSGYFTSRQALKGYERWTSNLLHAAEKLLASSPEQELDTVNVSQALLNIDNLAMAHGVVQHHDGVSGTSKQHVAYDYAMRLSIGQELVFETMNQVIGSLVSPANATVPEFSFCPLLNVSVCPALQALTAGQFLPIVLYNHLPFNRDEYVRLNGVPKLGYKLLDVNLSSIPSQLDPNEDYPAFYTLTFVASVPAMGFTTVFLATTTFSDSIGGLSQVYQPAGTDSTIENSHIAVTISGATNAVTQILIKSTGQLIQAAQSMLWYNASAGYMNSLSPQASGAYIFRPNSSTPLPVFPSANPTTIISGELVQEVRQVWNGWLQQTIRLYNTSSTLETEVTVQPMPINDQLGKELISRWTTNLATNGTWWTDSMGQEMQLRRLNYRPTWNLTVNEPVAGNYFPMNTAAFIRDGTKNVQFTLITDRSRGVSSLQDGQIESMVQRRLLYDDHRGVGEPLNETVPIRTRGLVIAGPAAGAVAAQRSSSLLLNNPLVLAFGPVTPTFGWTAGYTWDFSPLSAPLPPNVNLITMRQLEGGIVLLRLSHIFGVGDDPTLSQPAVVNLSSLFVNRSILAAVETQLTGNQPLAEVTRLQWRSQTADLKSSPLPGSPAAEALTVTLQPLQIRTFLLRLSP